MSVNPPMDTPTGRAQCTAKSKQSQERCKNRPVPGLRVCRFHGGATPAAKRAAALRLADLVDAAIGTLARVMTDPRSTPRDRLRAAENVLDRTGYGRTVNVADADNARALLLERLRAIRAGETATPDPVAAARAIVAGEVVSPAAALPASKPDDDGTLDLDTPDPDEEQPR